MTAARCGDCWKLWRVAGKARNLTENALSFFIVIFSVQLQQTETSDRKLCIFQCDEPLVKHCKTLPVTCDYIGAQFSNIGARCGNIGARHRVSHDIGDCGVSITQQMCNRVTNS